MSAPVHSFSRQEDGHSFALEPYRNRGEQRPDLSLRAFMRLVKMEKKSTRIPTRPAKPYLQRCAVQVRYTPGGSAGKWYSHGAYMAREVAGGLGFTESQAPVPVGETLADWRRQGDNLFFRLILSPEFGERLNLSQFTQNTMANMAEDLGTNLHWVAVIHRNTDNPHVHVVLRGLRDDGRELRIPRDYVQAGLRERAQEQATNQLGFRTEQDCLLSQKREIEQSRFTGLDRLLKQRARSEKGFLSVTVLEASPSGRELSAAMEYHLARRLSALERMGLARPLSRTEWAVEPNFETVLRSVQRTQDRLKMMAEHGVLTSDPQLPLRVLRPSQVKEVEGRILVHGQDEYSGHNFMLLETVQGELIRLPHNQDLIKARQQGALRPGHYLYLRTLPAQNKGGRVSYQVEDWGDAESLLKDSLFVRTQAARLAGCLEHGFGGWLGKLREAVNSQQHRAEWSVAWER